MLSWLLDNIEAAGMIQLPLLLPLCGGSRIVESPDLASASVFELQFAEKKAQKNHKGVKP